MSWAPLAVDALGRLAQRVVQGEVVFFIGAGFSIDNEGNTTSRLIGRLLIRFEAWTLCAMRASASELGKGAGSIGSVAAGLREDLARTFDLEQSKDSSAPFLAQPANQSKLNQAYYQFNDWMCTAFAELLQPIEDASSWIPFFEKVKDQENALRESHRAKDAVEFVAVDVAAVLRLRSVRDRSKALFLDTLGFNTSHIMAGAPGAGQSSAVEQSYGDKLRPRQHVLARLAREGLASALVTTNFDLLIEGAYRIAGFRMRQPAGVAQQVQDDPYPPVTFQEFQCVSCAPHFFQRGDQRRLVSVLKIHGDALEYRRRRAASASGTGASERSWSEYLRNIIFTFREIQNWREDFWSQDLIRTLLRSRTLAFCGYSAADPVLHDTFRSVYEEMERTHRRLRGDTAPADAAQPAAAQPAGEGFDDRDAPAFFFDLAGVTGFHAAELMRAASRGIGLDTPKRRDHPNRIAFNTADKFPDLDDSMIWLLHKVIRKRQQQAIKADLRRTLTTLLGRPCRTSTLDAIQSSFELLLGAEEARVQQLAASERAEFARVVGWTQEFHIALLREFALAEQLLRNPRPGKGLQQLRRWPWYYPTADHPEWTAWSAVLELAIRRLTAAWRGEPLQWRTDAAYAVSGDHPTILHHGRTRPRTPAHLRILLQGFQRAGYPPRPSQPARAHRSWELQVRSIPWLPSATPETPGAEHILSWAAGLDLSVKTAARFLGATWPDVGDNGE